MVVNDSFRWRASVFDFDGTLYDSAPDIARSLNAVARFMGRPERSVTEVRPLIGRGLGSLLTSSVGQLDDGALARARCLFLEAYEDGLWSQSQPFPGADHLMGELSGPRGLVTNKPRRFLGPLLDHLGWHFDIIVAGDDGYERKPGAGGIRAAILSMGVSEQETVFIGDHPVDQAAAYAAGVHFLCVPWGYCPEAERIEHFADLLHLVQGAECEERS